jgi:hypothetical protein
MKNKIRLLKIITFAAVIVFLIVACSDTKDKLNGTTWKGMYDDGDGEIYILTFNSPNITFTNSYGSESITMGGTYAISNDKITITISGEGTTEIKLSGNKLTVDALGGVTFTKQ